MHPMNERIAQCIEALGVKKKNIADRINVSAAFITQISTGASMPSDRTVSDFCREFHVNEEWLRTGDGEMFVKMSRRDEIQKFFSEITNGKDDDFQVRFISVLSRLNTEQWELLESIAETLAGKKGADQ